LLALLHALRAPAGPAPNHFHALLQFQLMGLNGAFLTADLFNLFVFFEVLLAASYGLLLHDANRARLRAGVHYVVFNLAGSALFLIAVSLLYGVAGTLNMADLAVKLAALPAAEQPIAQAAALLLLVVFAIKAALLPLYFWLPDTYASAHAPVAALFAIMTKVGLVAIARATTLTFGAGTLAGLAQSLLPVLAVLGLATLLLAAIGALAATRLRGLIAYLVVASAGTLMLAIGLGTEAARAAGLFYLVHSTLIAALWFLLADRLAAARGGSDRIEVPMSGLGSNDNGSARPWAALAAGFFMAAIAIAGLPPLGGFIGKAWLLQAAGTTPMAAWVIALVLASSLAIMVALGRAGSALLWKGGLAAPRQAQGERSPIAIPLGFAAVLGIAAGAGPISAYTAATAAQMADRPAYIRAVLGAQAAPPAYDIRREMRERGDLK
jgi:multicomponent K+:H+ antiporter subunit D